MIMQGFRLFNNFLKWHKFQLIMKNACADKHTHTHLLCTLCTCFNNVHQKNCEIIQWNAIKSNRNWFMLQRGRVWAEKPRTFLSNSSLCSLKGEKIQYVCTFFPLYTVFSSLSSKYYEQFESIQFGRMHILSMKKKLEKWERGRERVRGGVRGKQH